MKKTIAPYDKYIYANKTEVDGAAIAFAGSKGAFDCMRGEAVIGCDMSSPSLQLFLELRQNATTTYYVAYVDLGVSGAKLYYNNLAKNIDLPKIDVSKKLNIALEWINSKHSLACYVNDELVIEIDDCTEKSVTGLVPMLSIGLSKAFKGDISIYNAGIATGDDEQFPDFGFIDFDGLQSEEIPVWSSGMEIGIVDDSPTKWTVLENDVGSLGLINRGYINGKLGAISSALDELHAYAQALIGGK